MQTIAEGGAQSLFRGMGAPFATVAVYNAILFAARGRMESMLAHADGNCLQDHAHAHHTHKPTCICLHVLTLPCAFNPLRCYVDA